MPYAFVDSEAVTTLTPLLVTVQPHGMAVTHNAPCPIYGCENHAVMILDSNPTVLQPCWSCQEKGYKTVRVNGWKAVIVGWLTGGK